MDYFWKQQDDIPEGMGYPLFGLAHLLSVFITLMFVAVLCICILKKEEKKQKSILKAIPLIMIILEIFKDGFLISVHRFGIGYLPLHICSIGIFIFALREYLPGKKSKDIFGEIAFVIILPGSIIALFFADWTVYYPVWNFINLHSYVWHGLLVLYPLLIKLKGDISPSIKHIHWVLLFLCIIVPPIYIFDKVFKCNYFFLNSPVPNSPLSFMENYLGNPGYLLGYALLTLMVIFTVYLMIWVLEKIEYNDNDEL